MSIPHLKGGGVVWTYEKDHIINERRNTNLLDYMGLIINYLGKRRVGLIERY